MLFCRRDSQFWDTKIEKLFIPLFSCYFSSRSQHQLSWCGDVTAKFPNFKDSFLRFLDCEFSSSFCISSEEGCGTPEARICVISTWLFCLTGTSQWCEYREEEQFSMTKFSLKIVSQTSLCAHIAFWRWCIDETSISQWMFLVQLCGMCWNMEKIFLHWFVTFLSRGKFKTFPTEWMSVIFKDFIFNSGLLFSNIIEWTTVWEDFAIHVFMCYDQFKF